MTRNMWDTWGCVWDTNGMPVMDIEQCAWQEDYKKFLIGIAKNPNFDKEALKHLIKTAHAVVSASERVEAELKKHLDEETKRNRLLSTFEEDLEKMDFGDAVLNKQAEEWQKVYDMKTYQEVYNHLKKSDLIKNIPFKQIREYTRKKVKPMFKEQIELYHKRKVEAFIAQRDCFKAALRAHTSLVCASVAPPSFYFEKVYETKPNGDKILKPDYKRFNLNSKAIGDYYFKCYTMVEKMVTLGSDYTEAEAMQFMAGRYVPAKGHYNAWKKMAADFALSDFKFDTILKYVMAIFKKDGLLDKNMVWMQEETQAALDFARSASIWDVNFGIDDDCKIDNCDHLENYITPAGILLKPLSEMSDFKNNHAKNETFDNLNKELDFFKNFEKRMVDGTIDNVDKNTDAMFIEVMKLLEDETALAEAIEKGENPFKDEETGRRVLEAEADPFKFKILLGYSTDEG